MDIQIDGDILSFSLSGDSHLDFNLSPDESLTFDVSTPTYVDTDIYTGQTEVNPDFVGWTDDGSGVPVAFYNYNNQAWSGDTTVFSTGGHTVKIERQGTA